MTAKTASVTRGSALCRGAATPRARIENSREILGTDHLDVAQSLKNLALLCDAQGRYVEVQALYERVLAISEKALGPDHAAVATTVNNLALLFETQGRYAQARPLYERALAIWESNLGPEHETTVAARQALSSVVNLLSNSTAT